MERLLLKVKEVQERLNIGRSKVYDMIAQGELPYIKTGRCIRVPVKALNEWIESQQNKNIS